MALSWLLSVVGGILTLSLISGCSDHDPDGGRLLEGIRQSGEFGNSFYANEALGIVLEFPHEYEVMYDASEFKGGATAEYEGRLFVARSSYGDAFIQMVVPTTSVGENRISPEDYQLVLDSVLRDVFLSNGARLTEESSWDELCERIVLNHVVETGDGPYRMMRTYLLGYSEALVVLTLISNEPEYYDYKEVFDRSICAAVDLR